MSESATLWILGTIILVLLAVIGSLFGMLIAHMKECRDFRADVAAMKADLANIKHEIGDHERGIRGEMHALIREISPYITGRQRDAR